MLVNVLPKEPWGFLCIAALFAVLSIIGDTIFRGFAIEDVIGGIVVGLVGTGGGYLIARLAGAS